MNRFYYDKPFVKDTKQEMKPVYSRTKIDAEQLIKFLNKKVIE